MELKKSISETDRTLKSYGAVLETEWQMDKGERRSYQAIVPKRGTDEISGVSVFFNILLCFAFAILNKACITNQRAMLI